MWLIYGAVLSSLFIILFVWPINAIFLYIMAMLQKNSTSKIGQLFQMWTVAVIGITIRNHTFGKSSIDSTIYDRFANKMKYLICKKKKIVWIKPNKFLVYFSKIWLKPLEGDYIVFRFLNKIINLPNGNKNNIKLVFELALNIGQLFGHGYMWIFIHPSWYFNSEYLDDGDDIDDETFNKLKGLINFVFADI